MSADFLFRGSFEELDPKLFQLSEIEGERQFRNLILIPSESSTPLAVRQALSSPFHNIYAEGYPSEISRFQTEDELFNYEAALMKHRRHSDPRYYKGVEYANILEAIARRRCAELFAANDYAPDDIYVNVQPLSGAPANNAVEHALLEPGDTILSMDLLHGGHLSHGSRANRSGKLYNIVHYTVDPETEKIDYYSIQELADEFHPKLIIAGFSSYPWAANWKRFREIADTVGAYLLADIAHVAGLVAAGHHESPIGYAHVVSSTTHKTLCGPRGAIIMTTEPELSSRIDRAVFPGEQGGPHVNKFAAMAVAFKFARTEKFKQLQQQILDNCLALTNRLEERGFRIPYGGTNTHMMNIDTKSVKGPDGTTLSGDRAARILGLAGIVVNRNTIPGDRSAFDPSGIRMGTPWISQRGFKEAETIRMADIIADLLQSTIPYKANYVSSRSRRAKVGFSDLENAKVRVRDLSLSMGIDFEPGQHGYPHFYYIDDDPMSKGELAVLELKGHNVRHFCNFSFTSDVQSLPVGKNQSTQLYTPQGVIAGVLSRETAEKYHFSLPAADSSMCAAWLRSLSDGFVQIDQDDILKKAVGPVFIKEIDAVPVKETSGSPVSNQKPYFIGIENYEIEQGVPLPEFSFSSTSSTPKRSRLFEYHTQNAKSMSVYSGWEMPDYYTSPEEEHETVRSSAGIFDISHNGVFMFKGIDAAIFLDSVCGNFISKMQLGTSRYVHILDPKGEVLDDAIILHTGKLTYHMAVNPENTEMIWVWFQSVLSGTVRIDEKRPASLVYGRELEMLNLSDPANGELCKSIISIQGPCSLEVLVNLNISREDLIQVHQLEKNMNIMLKINDVPAYISRTGYTGEEYGYELYVHPDQLETVWNELLRYGERYEICPAGMLARESLRIEAGITRIGKELSGPLNIYPFSAGHAQFIKTLKPWFIGRDAYLEKEAEQTSRIIRFVFNDKGINPPDLGSKVFDQNGIKIGTVTSATIDTEGKTCGLALVEKGFTKKGTSLYIYSRKDETDWKALGDIQTGDRILIPSAAKVVRRFKIF